MKAIYIKIVFCVGIFLLLLWGGFHLFFWADRKQEAKLVTQNKQIARLSQEDIAKIKEGDIILRRGYGFFSDLIAERLNDSVYDLTHSGILYRKGNKWWVIHSLSADASDKDGMQEQSLQDFLTYSMPEKMMIVRTKNTTETDGKQIVERAKYYLAKRVPFDRVGEIDEPSKMYCTEMIWQILDTDLKLITLPKTPKERKDVFYSMTGMYDPVYFDIIVNKYP
ncbi:MAG: YiiX/YebB-like N1pC/P60 family cysteine hydrolase [Capnocytophaga sp.]|nr:YiiX/YebB-like N1pC/P60 family cysteine hydrolase [Capnocytophaga sp.]